MSNWIQNAILNQKGSPAIYTDDLANRPAAGYIGRLFVAKDTFAWYRDNGTTWDLIGGPGTGTITGSGTANYVPKFNASTSVLGNSQIFDNGTSVGIGTITPSALYKLDIAGDQRVSGKIVVNGYDIGETGNNNLFFGTLNYTSLTTGFDNVAIGSAVLRNATLATQNIAIGNAAMNLHVTGNYNIAIGCFSLRDGGGEMNVAVGHTAMFQASGSRNVAVGYESLLNNSASNDNTAIGYQSINSLQISGGKNSGVGVNVLSSLSTGENNTAIGYEAGFYITGLNPLQTNTTSVFIGSSTRASANGNTNEIVIGYNADGNGSNTATLGNNSIVNTYLKGVVNSTRQLITNTASTDALEINKTGTGFAINVTAGVSNFQNVVAVAGDFTSSVGVTGFLQIDAITNNFAELLYTENGSLKWNAYNDFNTDHYVLGTSGGSKFQFTPNAELLINKTVTNTFDKLQIEGSALITKNSGDNYLRIESVASGNPIVYLAAGADEAFIYYSRGDQEIVFGMQGALTALQIQSNGNCVFSDFITTGNPTGGTAATWKLGSYVAVAPAATGYVQIDIAGTAYKLLAST